jgi:hypothetical protein
VRRLHKELRARYLELSLKFDEPSTKDENVLHTVIVILKLLTPIVILLSTGTTKDKLNGKSRS